MHTEECWCFNKCALMKERCVFHYLCILKPNAGFLETENIIFALRFLSGITDFYRKQICLCLFGQRNMYKGRAYKMAYGES